MDQEQLRLELIERNADVVRRGREYAARSAEQLAWQPPDGGWSIGTTFEHLCTSHGLYLTKMVRLVAQAPEVKRGEPLQWRPSLGGGILVRSLSSPGKLRSPSAFAPAPRPRENVVQVFVEQHEQVAVLLAASHSMQWQRMRLGSPVTWLLRMNLADAFVVLVTHAERHLHQADGVAARMESAAPAL